jgi:predicted nucleic acid-binding protein
MAWAIHDTNIYLGHWERGLYERELALVRTKFIIGHSAVVLSELRRGAKTPKAQAVLERLYELAHLQWAPDSNDWWHAGLLVREIGDEQNWDRVKRRDFQNDALIGLTARSHGATVVTANRNDFELLAEKLDLRVIVAQAPPDAAP